MSGLTQLKAISPVDGRYYNQVTELSNYFSEYALIRYRVQVEIEYFIALCEENLPQLTAVDPAVFSKLRQIVTNFSEDDALWIKEKEKETNHDVKAVEYFVKDKFEKLGLSQFSEIIHLGLNSQDINNTLFSL